MELKRKKNIRRTGGDGAYYPIIREFSGFFVPHRKDTYRSSGASLSIWSTRYDSVLNKDIKIDAKKTHTQNGRVLVHYHPRIGETVDIRITPPVLRSNRPVHTAAADFATQRSLPPHLTNPIFTPVQRTGPFYAGAAPYTHDNGDAMFQSHLSKIFKKETG